MKKVILSVVTAGAFAIYAFASRVISPTSLIYKPIFSRPVTADLSNKNPTLTSGILRDGAYTGVPVDAYYGIVQVQATIQNSKLTDVEFLSYPNSRPNSVEVNSRAMPLLVKEAVSAQNAEVDTVSGATKTSEAFKKSLESALAKAK